MKRLVTILSVLLAVIALVICSNYVLVHRPVEKAAKRDPRNDGISMIGHYRYLVVPSVLVLDLRSVDGDRSMADVTRVLLLAAEAQKDRQYKQVVLAYRGTPKFLLEGDYFQTLGGDLGVQNPVYTIRTLPQNVYRLDGTPAFGTWTGGLLGVLGKQMEDFNAFHMQWYVDDAARRQGR